MPDRTARPPRRKFYHLGTVAREAHVPVIYRCYDGLVHGFAAFAGIAPEAEIAVREISGLFREGLEGRVAKVV